MEKYDSIGQIGEGSYGMVMKCRHKETGQLVAIKKFLESEEDKNVKKIAVREVKMLKQLHHENLINLIEVFRKKKRLYLVFEFVDHTVLDDLEKFPTGADEGYVKKVMWQVLKGVEFCHSHNIIHRDVKPENILVSKRGVVKICDFGFARAIAPPGEVYTDYVATRWYRGPELLVGDTSYGRAIDVWAVGCLFSEMLTGEPLFPGESDIDQLYLITKCFGNLISRHREIFSRNPLFIGMRLPEARELEPLDKRYPQLSLASLDIIKWSLRLDPSDRPTCSQLLRHEFFTKGGWAEKFAVELKAKVQKELEENPLLKSTQSHESKVDKDKPSPTEHQEALVIGTGRGVSGGYVTGGGITSGGDTTSGAEDTIPPKKGKDKERRLSKEHVEKEKDKERHKDRERDREERDKDKEKDRLDYDKDKERDKEREKHERQKDREKEKERVHKEKILDRERPDKDSDKEKMEGEKDKEKERKKKVKKELLGQREKQRPDMLIDLTLRGGLTDVETLRTPVTSHHSLLTSSQNFKGLSPVRSKGTLLKAGAERRASDASSSPQAHMGGALNGILSGALGQIPGLLAHNQMQGLGSQGVVGALHSPAPPHHALGQPPISPQPLIQPLSYHISKMAVANGNSPVTTGEILQQRIKKISHAPPPVASSSMSTGSQNSPSLSKPSPLRQASKSKEGVLLPSLKQGEPLDLKSPVAQFGTHIGGGGGSHTNLANGSKGILLAAIPQLTAIHTGLKGSNVNHSMFTSHTTADRTNH